MSDSESNGNGHGALHPSRMVLPYVRQWIAAQEQSADATATAAVAAQMRAKVKAGKLAEHYEEQLKAATERAEEAEALAEGVKQCVAESHLERWFDMVVDGWRRAEDSRAEREFAQE